MFLLKTVHASFVTLSVVLIMGFLVWNYTPIYQVYVFKFLNGKEEFKPHEMADFFQVPYRNVYISKQAAMIVNKKRFYIISVGFVQKGDVSRYATNGTQQMICLKRFKNGTIIKSGVHIQKLPTERRVRMYKYHASFIHCEGVSDSDIPVQTSILPADQPGADRKWLEVIDRRNHTVPAKDGIAMCVNSIYNHRSPRAIIEWVEVQRLMKVDKIYIYGYTNVSRSVEEVLKYYQELGVLQIVPFNHGWPRFHETFSRRSHDRKMARKHKDLDLIEDTHHQFAAYNDCLYRFGSLHKYLVYIDLDEFIVAGNKSEIRTYTDILKSKKRYGTLYFPQVLYCSPEKLHTENLIATNTSEDLVTGRYIYRTPPLYHILTKVIVRPNTIQVIGVHRPYNWWGAKREFLFRIKEARKQHYKPKLYNKVKGQENCLIEDNSMLPFQKPLLKGVQTSVDHIINRLNSLLYTQVFQQW